MFKVKAVSRSLLGALLLLLGASCASPVQTERKMITIKETGWVHQNISPNYWTANKPGATQFLDLTVEYSGESLTVADFDSLKVTSPSGTVSWTIPITAGNLDPGTKTVSVSLWNSTHSTNGSVMETGDYEVQLVLKNGQSAHSVRSVPPPGSKTDSGNGYTYSEDFTGTKTALHLPALKRPVLFSDAKSNLGISVKFQSNDPLLFGGRAYFYNKTGGYIARSGPFVTYGTGIAGSNINGGAGFFNNGTTNTITLTPTQLVYANQGAYDEISSYVVSLTDGFQYLGTSSTYDSQSWGDRTAFAPPLVPDGSGWSEFRVSDDALLENTFLYPVEGTYQAVLTEARVSFTNLSGSPYFGILFCYQNKENHYRFRAETGGGSYSLEKVVNGVVTRLNYGSTGWVNRGSEINVLTVSQTSPGVFQIRVNSSSSQHTLTDSTFTGGASGYYLATSWFMPASGYQTKVQMALPLANP